MVQQRCPMVNCSFGLLGKYPVFAQGYAKIAYGQWLGGKGPGPIDPQWPPVTPSDPQWPPVTPSDPQWPPVTPSDPQYLLVNPAVCAQTSISCTFRFLELTGRSWWFGWIGRLEKGRNDCGIYCGQFHVISPFVQAIPIYRGCDNPRARQ